MRSWTFWIWPGLAAVGCLTALAIWFEASLVELDLQSRAVAELGKNHAWAQVSLNGRDLTLTGLAPDEDNQQQALNIARSVYGVRVVTNNSTLLPEEKPYRLKIEKTADGVSLSGFVPSEAARTDIIATLTGMLPGIELSDQLKLARGAPSGLVELAAYGLAAFPRFSTGALEITDRSLTISGQALDPYDHDIALAALSSIPASAGTLSSVEIKPAPVRGEYTWAAILAEDGLKLSGYAPDAKMRQGILAKAEAVRSDASVQDGMRFASGVPDGIDWEMAAGQALSILSNMASGSAGIQGRVLTLDGQALDGEAFRKIQEMLTAGLSGGLVLGTSDIGMAPGAPFEWSASRTSDGLSLSGFLPSEAMRARILDVAGLKFGSLPVADAMEVGSGAAAGFESVVLVALQAISRLDTGEARIVDGKVLVQGLALNENAVRDIARLLKENLPEEFDGDPQIEVAPAPGGELAASACQEELNRLAGMNTVRFETGDTAIQDHSYGFLDKIAFTARQCGQTRLEIAGHTDSDGTDEDNLILSVGRAKAVFDFMAAAGVAADRLSANGYGESRPVESNETDAGRAANRRIEFRVSN